MSESNNPTGYANWEVKGSVPVQDQSTNWFRQPIIDNRFSDEQFYLREPDGPIPDENRNGGGKVNFTFPPWKSGNAYRPSDCYIKIRCKLTKADGVTKPDNNQFVSTKNHIVHSCIKHCYTFLNGQQLEDADDNYMYK